MRSHRFNPAPFCAKCGGACEQTRRRLYPNRGLRGWRFRTAIAAEEVGVLAAILTNPNLRLNLHRMTEDDYADLRRAMNLATRIAQRLQAAYVLAPAKRLKEAP